MKLNRKLILVAALVLSVAMATSGTLAYLTDRDSAANVFTMGNVSIKLNENFQQGVKVLPGQSVDKVATITNNGSEDAYVWFETVVPFEMRNSLVTNYNWNGDWKLINDPFSNNPDYVMIDGVKYAVSAYRLKTNDGKLAVGQTTAPLFTEVELVKQIDITPEGEVYWVDKGVTKDLKWNINTNGSPIMYVSAYAIQAEGFENFDAAYDAYKGQWGNNGKEWGEASFEADISWYDASENTYEISNASQLFGLAKLVNEDGVGFGGKTITLTADIDLANANWDPIGQSGYGRVCFYGTFDGGNHTIKNLNVTNWEAGNNEGAAFASGLFGFTENANIKNLTIDGAKIEGHHYVGAVVGYIAEGSVANCTVKNAVVSNTHKNDEACGDKTGAVIGYVNGNSTISNCHAENCKISGARDAGQVVGCAIAANGNVVTDCTAENVDVTKSTVSCSDDDAGKNIGGIVGRK